MLLLFTPPDTFPTSYKSLSPHFTTSSFSNLFPPFLILLNSQLPLFLLHSLLLISPCPTFPLSFFPPALPFSITFFPHLIHSFPPALSLLVPPPRLFVFSFFPPSPFPFYCFPLLLLSSSYTFIIRLLSPTNPSSFSFKHFS